MTQKKPWTLDLVGFDTRLMTKPRDVLMALKNDVLCVSASLREKTIWELESIHSLGLLPRRADSLVGGNAVSSAAGQRFTSLGRKYIY